MTTKKNIERETMLSRKELSTRWGMSVETIKRWEKRGWLPFVKMGPRLKRYRMSEVTRVEAEMEASAKALDQ